MRPTLPSATKQSVASRSQDFSYFSEVLDSVSQEFGLKKVAQQSRSQTLNAKEHQQT